MEKGKHVFDVKRIKEQLNVIYKVKSHVGIPAGYLIRMNWLNQEGSAIEIGGVIQMHPYDFCHAVHQSTKDSNKALDLLRKYTHEHIDRVFSRSRPSTKSANDLIRMFKETGNLIYVK